MKINLWQIYFLSTNSKTDIWPNNGVTPIGRINKPKKRPTIAIQLLYTLASGEEIYLVCQFNTTKQKNSLKIPYSLINQGIHGYVLPINIID